MIEITKDQVDLIKQRMKNPYIVVCSKRKRGQKGCRKSGKTYFCPESNSYLRIINGGTKT